MEYICIPRTRGGVSHRLWLEGEGGKYSPHSRGCFSCTTHQPVVGGVFPALAGVFLMRSQVSALPMRIPRTRGGVSGFQSFLQLPRQYSPHSRGCFQHGRSCDAVDRVFPALAGVFLTIGLPLVRLHSIPRTRGGVSLTIDISQFIFLYSPHSRGCFSLPCWNS